MDYEIMCKQTEDKDFCDCETEKVKLIDKSAQDNVLEEFYISRTVTKEVYIEPEPLDFEKESTLTSFVAGFFICFLIWSITILIYCLVKRYREKSSIK